MPRFPLLLLLIAALAGCGSQPQPSQDLLRPDTSDMQGLKGTDLPPNTAAPMPSNWHGFKAY